MNTTKKIPLRKCAACGEMKAKKNLIRVLKTPQEEVTLDVTGKKNGRGAYICPTLACLQLAKKNKGLERSLKTTIPSTVYEKLEKEIAEIEK